MEVKTKGGITVAIGDLKAETDAYKIYAITLPEKKAGMLKIGISAADNGILDREAFVLQYLKKEAVRLEESYASKHPGNPPLNYQIVFPELLESYIDKEQDGRRVNVMSLTAVADKLSDLSPLSWISEREGIRIDPRTSAWILGKLLKALSFAHNQGVMVKDLSGDNILINRNEHLVHIFGWEQAQIYSDPVPAPEAADEISQITQQVVIALGGNPDTGDIPADEQLEDSRYADMIKSLVRGEARNASDAHSAFYALIRSMWPTSFHHFTAYKLS